MKTYKLDTPDTRPATEAMRALRRRMEKEILDLFSCPKCGTGAAPFLDYFDLDMDIQCECGEQGRLRDFIDPDR